MRLTEELITRQNNLLHLICIGIFDNIIFI
jgi:hypothetical protein